MDILQQQLDQRLQKHLSGIDLQNLSRISPERIKANAIPKISLVELVSAESFKNAYVPLYESMFHGPERERTDLIIQRLADDFIGVRSGLAPYRIVGLRDHAGEAIGAAQFSVLMVQDGTYAVPYVQYIYVRPQNRRQDLSEVLHTLVLAVATADGKKVGREECVVPFTLFETEPPGHGVTQSSRTNATERTTIHARSGARAIMLRPTGSGAEGEGNGVVSAHVQPGLEPAHEPLTLVWAIRPSPAAEGEYDVSVLGKRLSDAFYQSLRDEGFPEENIALAERIVERRMEGREFFEMPLEAITEAMYRDLAVMP